MKLNHTLFVFVPFAMLLASCMSLGINIKHKTPHKAAKLPSFSVKDSLIGYNNAFRSCYDVKHYDIHVSIDPVRKSIRGAVSTRFALLEPSSAIQLDLDAQLIIDSITQNKQALKFSRKYTAVNVELRSQNSNQAVTVYYHGKPLAANRPPWEGGFVWKKDQNKKSFASVACEGTGAKTWLPVKTYLGDEPDSVTIHLGVPKDLVAVSNGKLISAYETGSEKIVTWQTSYPINPYNITFYVGDYTLFETPYTTLDGESMKLSYYVLKENEEKARKHFAQTDKILKTYENLYGAYPWVRDGYKLVESPFAGMEHQTAIAYGNGYKNERNEDYDYIILHESAHEWWGNAVSVADFSDVWIHEGMATYAEALYVERTKGYSAYLDYISWTALTVMNKKPVIGPSGLYYWNYKDGDPYNKGSVMLHSLRNHLQNDSLFFSILKTFYKNSCYRITDTKAFIALVNQMTGKDLNYFFKQYLYQRASPLLVWNYDYGNRLIFSFKRVDPGFTTPIEVEQGNEKFYIYPTADVQFVTLPQPASVPLRMNSRYTYIQDGFEKIQKSKK